MDLNPNRLFSKELEKRLEAIEAACRYLPCTVIVHSVPDAAVIWMSERGLRLLGTSIEELRALGASYHERYFNPEDAADYVPKVMGLLQRADPDEVVSYFQQVRYSPGEPYRWYLSVTRIFAFDEETKAATHAITTAFPIDPEHHLAAGVARLLEENNFLRANLGRLHSLSRREKEVLRLLATGQANKEVASALGISTETVSTHRRNLKRKLGAATLADLGRYAQAQELL
jgi:DNA-binding CsgD family transcriptional regulator